MCKMHLMRTGPKMKMLEHFENDWCRLYVTIDWLNHCLVALVQVFSMVLMYHIVLLWLCQLYLMKKKLLSSRCPAEKKKHRYALRWVMPHEGGVTREREGERGRRIWSLQEALIPCENEPKIQLVLEWPKRSIYTCGVGGEWSTWWHVASPLTLQYGWRNEVHVSIQEVCMCTREAIHEGNECGGDQAL